MDHDLDDLNVAPTTEHVLDVVPGYLHDIKESHGGDEAVGELELAVELIGLARDVETLVLAALDQTESVSLGTLAINQLSTNLDDDSWLLGTVRVLVVAVLGNKALLVKSAVLVVHAVESLAVLGLEGHFLLVDVLVEVLVAVGGFSNLKLKQQNC